MPTTGSTVAQTRKQLHRINLVSMSDNVPYGDHMKLNIPLEVQDAAEWDCAACSSNPSQGRLARSLDLVCSPQEAGMPRDPEEGTVT